MRARLADGGKVSVAVLEDARSTLVVELANWRRWALRSALGGVPHIPRFGMINCAGCGWEKKRKWYR